MTKFQALVIKYWRVREENSWRMVHYLYQKRYVPREKWKYPSVIHTADAFMEIFGYRREEYPLGIQAEGRALCYEAQKLLNENWEL